MKSYELSNKHASRPTVYVDLDGVLADFNGAIAQHHKVSHWREIHRQDLVIDQIAQKPGFFRNLEVLPNARRLIAGVMRLAGSYDILSSPLQSQVEQSSAEKAQWLHKHFASPAPHSVVFEHNKYLYARQPDGTPNILIDDWKTNIKLWQAHGGIGIRYRDADCDQVLAELRQALTGGVKPDKVSESPTELVHDLDPKLFTHHDVLKYINGIHKDYHLDKPIRRHKIWQLIQQPVRELKTPEYVHQDDPYRRVIDLDWDHIDGIDVKTLHKRPVVCDESGWVLDGNHRVTAARAAGVNTIPVIRPYNP